MSHRFLPARARSALLAGTLASAVLAANMAPVFVPSQGIAQARPRQSERQSLSAERKKGRQKQRTVTTTFSSDAAISIPDSSLAETRGAANPYPSTITARGIRQGRVVDVNLILRGFSHNLPADVAVLLVAPNGANAIVMADVGNPSLASRAVIDFTLTLDDEAAAPLPENALLTSGSFQSADGESPGPNGEIEGYPVPAPTPSNAVGLSIFDGVDPNGDWQLSVLDDNTDDTGAITRGWSLEITASTKTRAHRRGGRH